MNIFFDVDYTIISWDGSLRPHVREVFEKLCEDGHNIYVWSGVGIRWDVVEQYKLGSFVKGCFLKPTWDYANALERHGVTVRPDFCVDDHREVVAALGGVAVTPYGVNHNDSEMLRVYEAIKALDHGSDGHKADPVGGVGDP